VDASVGPRAVDRDMMSRCFALVVASAARDWQHVVVQIALKRPYTFVVLALLIAIFGSLAALRTPTDIFPGINIPVISVVWTHTGLSPNDMSGRVIYYYERTLTAQVGNIDHIESQSLVGYGVVKTSSTGMWTSELRSPK